MTMQEMQAKIEEQEKMLDTLQRMCANSAKQAADGLKFQISSLIKSSVEAYNSGIAAELDDAEKADFYEGLLEVVFSSLRCNGIEA